MKLYVIIEKNDGGSGLWGEYLILHGVYTDKNLAKDRVEELNDKLDEHGYIIDHGDGFIDYTYYNYEMITVDSDKPINEYLGGYAE
jgi:hypothetical protein